MKKNNIYKIALVGVMAALVFASSNLSIPIPLGVENTRLHLGNVFCLLSGLLLGAVPGGLAAGIGSAFFDLFNPLYISSAPFTFVFKFLMAFICGSIAYMNGKKGENLKLNLTGAIIGAVTYVILYLSKGYISNVWFLNMEAEKAQVILYQKLIVSTINAILAVALAIPLVKPLKSAIKKLKHFND